MIGDLVVQWKEPPPPARNDRRSQKWEAVNEALRSRPGVWALVAENTSATVATAIRRSSLAALRGGVFEARSVNSNDQAKADIYARFMGDQ